ncbi:hypothetical protein EAI_16855, partial [Harpegnathos saltator]
IHVIGANSMDIVDLRAWEILLHLEVRLYNLIIILIGPELKTGGYKEHGLCEICRQKENKLSFVFVPMLYHDYIQMTVGHRKPSIIVGSHVDFNKGDTWSESIKVIQDQGCPLLLGFSYERKALNNIIKIQKTLKINKEPRCMGKNYFAGLAPYKNLETGNIYFRNDYL